MDTKMTTNTDTVSVLVTPLQMTTGGKKKSHTFESERHNSLIYCVNFDT